MAMNKDILGQALYDAFTAFNNKDINATGNIEAARLAFCKVMADEVIKHIKTAAVITLNPLGLTAAAVAVTGTATSSIV